MPELIAIPTNPVWPPRGAGNPGVTRHVIGTVEESGRKRTEGLSDVCERYSVGFETLMSFNFSLNKGEPRYFEKINWYLKTKLGCTRTTPKGNFIFSGGETIYVPPTDVTFPDTPVTAPKPTPPEAKPIVWSLAATTDGPGGVKFPGVDRKSDVPSPSKMPGRNGEMADRMGAIAKLVQGLAEVGSRWLANQATENRFDEFANDPKLLQRLTPVGTCLGMVVVVRKLKSVQSPNFPMTPNGAFFVGCGNDPKLLITDWLAPKRIEPPVDPKISRYVYEFYWGTREYEH